MKLLTRAACVLLLACSALGAASCSSETGKPEKPSATSQVFAGLDSGLVREVLSNPRAIENAGFTETEAESDSLWQGMVRNFATCRSAYEGYASWRTTGEAPSWKPPPRPANPREPSNKDSNQFDQDVSKAFASGDPANVEKLIVGEGSCGAWIPAQANKPGGPTIEQAIRAGQTG